MSEPVTESAIASALEIDAEGADFLARRANQARWTAEDADELDRWLSRSLAHQTAFWRLESVWDRANRLDALRQLPSRQLNAALTPRRRSLFLGLTAAAVAVVAVGLPAIFPTSTSHAVTYSTAVGGRETIRVADGSRIDLNTDTILRTRFSDGKRNVELVKGEALFQIKHDDAHPFVVSVGGHIVTDLGTKFLIREEGGRLKVALLEGSARLSATGAAADGNGITLTPGDEAIVTSMGVSVRRKALVELDAELGWRRGVLVFHRATLADVAREYNRYNQQKIFIADEVAGKRVINATLPSTDVPAFARMARNFLGLHVENHEGEIVISR